MHFFIYYRAPPEMPLSIYNGVCFVEKAEVVRAEGKFQYLALTLRTAQSSSDIIPDSADIKILHRMLRFGLSCQVSAKEFCPVVSFSAGGMFLFSVTTLFLQSLNSSFPFYPAFN